MPNNRILVASTQRPFPEYVMPVLVAETIELDTEEIFARVLGGTMSRSAESRSYSDSSIVSSSVSLGEEISESGGGKGWRR